jgi:hypothetical protein
LLSEIRKRLTFANVVSVISLFIALGAGAYAAGLAPDSVKSKHIVNGQVKKADIVPTSFQSAGLPTADETCTGIADAWASDSTDGGTVGFHRDPLGWVHLTGLIEKCGNPTNQLFTLPPGYQAGPDTFLPILVFSGSAGEMTNIEIQTNGEVWVNGSGPNAIFSLDGVSWRCGPSGQNGCP